MHKHTIKLSSKSDLSDIYKNLEEFIANIPIPDKNRKELTSKVSKTIEIMVSSGEEMIEQGSNFTAKQVVSEDEYQIIITANYTNTPPSFIQRIINLFR